MVEDIESEAWRGTPTGARYLSGAQQLYGWEADRPVVRRRALLRAGGLGVATGLTGCISSLPFVDDAGVDAVWSADRGHVVDVEPFHGWVYTRSSEGSPVIAAHDPSDGSIEWSCDACLDATVSDDRLYLQTYDGDHSVAAYSSPVRQEWTANGRFGALDDDTLYLVDDPAPGTPESHGVLRAIDVTTGALDWVYRFDTPARGIGPSHAREDYYAVIAPPDLRTRYATRIDAETGEREWVTPVSTGVRPESRFQDDSLYVGYEHDTDYRTGITAIDAASGIDRWRHQWEAYIAYPRWVGADTVLATVVLGNTYEHETVALATADGTTQWHADEHLIGVTDDLAYLHRDAVITARRIGDGSVHHEFDLATILEKDGQSITRYALVGATLYLTAGPRLVALDSRTGTVRWRFVADRPLDIADVHADRIYVSSPTTFYAVDR